MFAHPAELRIRDIHRMQRQDLIGELLAFNEFCYFQFSPGSLEQRGEHELRLLLLAARSHYHARGY